ncbi:hypothetical protein [Nannocystis punicea]|uniref:Uncharacterized protein n=1 Tax=Nannocystis punicea TaxID=2995304 RepID=A0ABY7H9N7_9BACT|nr:hypothetical protein [Nannocystis poenicansa]WAS95749.1 hypothetical protein O0S08_06265 [Nannocystis poenicansa]
MPLTRWLSLAALALGLSLVEVGRAQACSCLRRQIGPGRLYLGTGGTLPADATGIPWSGTPNMAPDQVRLTREAGGRRVVVEHELVREGEIVLIVPRTGLRPGDVYTVTVREDRWRTMKERRPELEREFGSSIAPAEITARVTVTATGLVLTDPTLRTTEHIERPVQSQWADAGACSSAIQADTLAFSVDLPPEAEPFRDYLLYRTLVDDREWQHTEGDCAVNEPGRTWTRQPGTDRIFSECPADPRSGARGLGRGVAAGRHRVRVEIRSPDGRHAANAAAEVELGCGRPEQPGSGPPNTPARPPAPAPGVSKSSEPPPLQKNGCVVANVQDAPMLIVFGALVVGFARRRRPVRDQ